MAERTVGVRSRDRRTLLAFLAVCLTIAAGGGTGRIDPGAGSLIDISTAASVVILAVALLVHRHSVVAVFLFYIGALIYFDPFSRVFATRMIVWGDVLFMVTLLIPAVLGSLFFPEKLFRLGAVSAWLFLYASVSILVWNMYHESYRVGFFSSCVDCFGYRRHFLQ